MGAFKGPEVPRSDDRPRTHGVLSRLVMVVCLTPMAVNLHAMDEEKMDEEGMEKTSADLLVKTSRARVSDKGTVSPESVVRASVCGVRVRRSAVDCPLQCDVPVSRIPEP